MTTATAPAPTMETLRQNVALLDAELKSLRGKEATAQKTVAELEAESRQINERIASGTMRASASTELAVKLAQAKATLEGFAGLIAAAQNEYNAASTELRQQEVVANRAGEIAAIAALREEGAAILGRLETNLKATMAGDLARFNQIRKELDDTMVAAARHGFPIPPSGQLARVARSAMDKQLFEILKPLKFVR